MSSPARKSYVLVLLVVPLLGCDRGAPPPPDVFSDGSAARPPPVALEGVEGPSILTRVRVLMADSVEPRSLSARCLDPATAVAHAVERVGVSGASLTLLGRDGVTVYGCDTSVPEKGGSSVCGHAFGRLDSGRLGDPRLSITCRGPVDELLGFAWVQPGAGASYVVVARGGYSEVYPVRGELPVRVMSDDVDPDRVSVTFALGEHASDGRHLRSYVLEGRVSG